MSDVQCSYCHKDQHQVFAMISTPRDYEPQAYICDECIEVCAGIVKRKRGQLPSAPMSIKEMPLPCDHRHFLLDLIDILAKPTSLGGQGMSDSGNSPLMQLRKRIENA